MAEVWGAIQRGIGGGLAGIYEALPLYGVAIILLTFAVRVLLIPLTIKQIRSMAVMQKVQPEIRKIQEKYKGVRDPEQRKKMNEELMGIYRSHGANPLGSCFPILMQAPVFIALFTVLRASEFFVAIPAVEVPDTVLASDVVCSPPGAPRLEGDGPVEITCAGPSVTETIRLEGWRDTAGRDVEAPTTMISCSPRSANGRVVDFQCHSPGGTGHLPKTSQLYADIIEGQAAFLGMELACTPSEAGSEIAIQRCAPPGTEPGGAGMLGYYSLILLMAGTTYYQQKQMLARAKHQGPQIQQMRMMMRILPIFLGGISFVMPAGVTVYWIVSNVWTIGQQFVFLRAQDAREAKEQQEQELASGKKDTGRGGGDGAGTSPEPADPPTKNGGAADGDKGKSAGATGSARQRPHVPHRQGGGGQARRRKSRSKSKKKKGKR